MIFRTASAAQVHATVDSLLDKKERFYQRAKDNDIEIIAVADDHTALWTYPIPRNDLTANVWCMFYSEEDFESLANRVHPILKEILQ